MEDTNKIVNTRSKAREFVFTLLFAKAFAPGEDADTVYARELENAEAELGDQLDYVHKVFFGVSDNLADIDAKISAAAVGWSLSRLSKAALTIMRLCIYEMISVDDVPKRVALNEAVELAKKYDEDKTPGFINGVLNSIARSLPDRDCDK
ncbi:MAG: transcription antitermination factor NusB [Clostridia bacterium]|nr:transcription antitermination factor NusB [Clostridia bacterium]